jgi:hypothetical protein
MKSDNEITGLATLVGYVSDHVTTSVNSHGVAVFFLFVVKIEEKRNLLRPSSKAVGRT